jgi:hypothetical protein
MRTKLHSGLVAAVAGVAAWTTGARAEPQPKKLKAEFLCGIYADGKIKKPITGAKVGKITDAIACALHLADPDEPGHAVHVRTLRGGKEVSNVTGTVHDDGSSKDLEIYLKPSVKNESGEIAWKPCEDFEIEAAIMDPGGQFKKTIKVVQGCPKPKPVKGKLACFYQTSDGTQYTWPGNGAKKKPRLEGDLMCGVTSKSDELADMKGSFEIKGKGTPKLGDGHPMEDGSGVDVTFEASNYGPCASFTVIAKVIDKDGAERFSNTLAIAQNCPH